MVYAPAKGGSAGPLRTSMLLTRVPIEKADQVEGTLCNKLL